MMLKSDYVVQKNNHIYVIVVFLVWVLLLTN